VRNRDGRKRGAICDRPEKNQENGVQEAKGVAEESRIFLFKSFVFLK